MSSMHEGINLSPTISGAEEQPFDLPEETPQGEEEQYENPIDDKFHVVDEGTADYVVKLFTGYDDERKRVKAMYEKRMKSIDNKQNSLKYFYEQELRNFVGNNLPHNRKSIDFEHGSVGWRTTPQKLEIEREKDVLQWAKDKCTDAVKVKESLLKKPIMEWIKDKGKGEIPDGVKVIPKGEKFFIK